MTWLMLDGLHHFNDLPFDTAPLCATLCATFRGSPASCFGRLLPPDPAPVHPSWWKCVDLGFQRAWKRAGSCCFVLCTLVVIKTHRGKNNFKLCCVTYCTAHRQNIQYKVKHTHCPFFGEAKLLLNKLLFPRITSPDAGNSHVELDRKQRSPPGKVSRFSTGCGETWFMNLWYCIQYMK